jgi:hypothetical protein
MGCTAYHESRHVRTSYVCWFYNMQVQAHNWEEIAQLCALKHVEVTVRQLIAQIHAFVTLTALTIIHLVLRCFSDKDVCCSNISAVGLVAARADWDYTSMATVCCSLR